MNVIHGERGWRIAYHDPANRKLIWIYIALSNGEIIFLDSYDKWLSMQQYCVDHRVNIVDVGLQYKTNRIIENVENCDGVYVVTSLKADFGASARKCITIGKVKGDTISKQAWYTPELIFAYSSVDRLQESFEKAIVYHDKKIKTKNM